MYVVLPISPYGVYSVSHRGGRTLEAAKFLVNIYVMHMKKFEMCS